MGVNRIGKVAVRNTRTAEAVKLTENVFRAVNIALVNELKIIFEKLDVDVWEVIEAAATKPFGYMPFYPGPGVGGHCIPVDPYYLIWKARKIGVGTRIIELAAEINAAMPEWVLNRVREIIGSGAQGSIDRIRVLVVGLAYKENVLDIRESPSLSLMRLLSKAGMTVSYFDPLVEDSKQIFDRDELSAHEFLRVTCLNRGSFDGVVIVTDHDVIDWTKIMDLGCPIIDTRNAMKKRGYANQNIFKA